MENITERIKTFEDACRELDKRAESNECIAFLLADYESNRSNINTKCALAYMKLCIIAAALNDGWELKFTKGECSWFPWFIFLTEKELNDKSEEWKAKHNVCLFGGSSSNGAYCCIAYASSQCVWSRSRANVSANLSVKSKVLAEYFGQQFIDIWSDYVALPRKEEECYY